MNTPEPRTNLLSPADLHYLNDREMQDLVAKAHEKTGTTIRRGLCAKSTRSDPAFHETSCRGGGYGAASTSTLVKLTGPAAKERETAEMMINSPRPAMTRGRAALIALLDAYSAQAAASASLSESQKLMYFLQIAGEPLELKYENNRHGPHADNLRDILKVVEGQYLQGFGEESHTVTHAEPIDVLPDALAAASEFLEEHPDTQTRINRVLHLASGYETPYGLELLASVHWLVRENPQTCRNVDHVVDAVRNWTTRKGRMFTPSHIRSALESLQTKGWIST